MSAAKLSEVLSSIGPPDPSAARLAWQRQRLLTKPSGGLGRLESISIQQAGIFGSERPRIRGKALIVAAGDHGIVAQGVTGYPREVTAHMVGNFLAGGAAVSVMARHASVRPMIVDAGVAVDLPDHPESRKTGAGSAMADISRSRGASVQSHRRQESLRRMTNPTSRGTRETIRDAKEYARQELHTMGVPVTPSVANFVLVKVGDATEVRLALLRRGFGVWDCTSFGLPEHIRIGMRQTDECRRLVAALKQVLAGD